MKAHDVQWIAEAEKEVVEVLERSDAALREVRAELERVSKSHVQDGKLAAR